MELVERGASGGHGGVGAATGGHEGVATGRNGGRRWNTNEGKLLGGLPNSSEIGISMLIFCFLINCLELVNGAVAVLTLLFRGDGMEVGGETGTATRL